MIIDLTRQQGSSDVELFRYSLIIDLGLYLSALSQRWAVLLQKLPANYPNVQRHRNGRVLGRLDPRTSRHDQMNEGLVE